MTDKHQAALDAAIVYKRDTQSVYKYAEPLDASGIARADEADQRLQASAQAQLRQDQAAYAAYLASAHASSARRAA